ncbi:MAG: biopolymer transporter ExbD, partial [Bacteroidales bacterium]|nr:biopolymer transporter ExbD [Bacteroidales bacterium]
MARFVKTGGKTIKALNTSSLPDIVFMILFFFMAVTTMRETDVMVTV